MASSLFTFWQHQSKASIGLLLIVLAVYLAVSFWVERKVVVALDGLPNLTYRDLSISIWQGDLQLEDVCILSNKALVGGGENLLVDTLSIEGISYSSLFNNIIKIDRLVLAGVSGSYTLTEEECPEENSEIEKENDWTGIKVNSLEVSGEMIRLEKSARWEMTADAVNLALNDYVYTPGSPLCPKGWKSFTGQLNEFVFYSIGAPYRYAVGNIQIAGQENEMLLSQFAIVPVYDKADWSHQFQYKKSRLELKVAEVRVGDFAFERLINEQQIILDTLRIYRPQLEVYSNELKLPCSNCYKPLLHEKLHQLATPLEIGFVAVEEGEIEVDTWSSGSKQKIELVFSQLNAQIDKLSNQAKKGPVLMNAQCNLFDNVPLEVEFKLSLEAPHYPYTYKGWLGAVDIRRMNKILGEASKVDVKSGQISQLNFQASADNRLATGEVQLKYEELKITLKNEEDRPRKMMSAILNTLVIKSESDGLESGLIHYPRDPNHGFFHQCWHSLKSGLSSVILPDVLLRKQQK